MASMARLAAVIVGLCLLAPASSAGADPVTQNIASGLFSDYVMDGGQKLEVADPLGDPKESNTVLQDSTAKWQNDLVFGLLNQRKAERDFIANLEVGGKTLNEMVNNITNAFHKLEAARQKKGYQLIKEHFENEIKLLKKSQTKVMSHLSKQLAAESTDSDSLKALKAKALSIVESDLKQQVGKEKSLFAYEISQIKAEHGKQIARVKSLLSLINDWKESFHSGLVKSEKQLQKISESWDWL